MVNNRFSSKGGSAPLFGQIQPAADLQEDPTVNGSLDERQAQAQAVVDYLNQNSSINNPDAKTIVLGDLNEFEFISPVEDILGGPLTNLTDTLPADERYSFIFQGNSQSLDHILVSDALLGGSQFDIVHVNVEFAETPGRASDHDPLLARFDFEAITDGQGDEDDDAEDELLHGGRWQHLAESFEDSFQPLFAAKQMFLGAAFASTPMLMGEDLLAGFRNNLFAQLEDVFMTHRSVE
ncbi:MAG: hypothetical protein F6K04_25935 [Leptolyngbya sp. SIO4C5]|nr:hypothetical protein [Leptolyngbya sp. SIO4C5]